MRLEDDNRARVGKALEHLVNAIASLVDDAMREYIAANWNILWAASDENYPDRDWRVHHARNWSRLPSPPSEPRKKISKTDPQYLLKALRDFPPAFHGTRLESVRGPAGRAAELMDIRGLWAHEFGGPAASISDEDALRALELIELLLDAVEMSEWARRVRKLRLRSPDWDLIDWEYVEDQSRVAGKLANAFDGREAERAELAHFFETATDSRLLVAGERYAGKSALLAEAFVNVNPNEVVVLGYFVPWNERRNRTSEAMLRSLIRQAHLVIEGEELLLDKGDRVNPGKLKELLSTLVMHARGDGRAVVVVVDGIDEDMSESKGIQTMADMLARLSIPDLKLIVSCTVGHIPEHLSNWPRLPVTRTPHVEANRQQMKRELESIFDMQAPSRTILQFLTFAGGSFGVDELARLTDSHRRKTIGILGKSEERVFRVERNAGEPDRWGFAHPEYADISRKLFEESAPARPIGELIRAAVVSPETATFARLDEWARDTQADGWPGDTPRYLLIDFPDVLADRKDLEALCRLLFDANYLRAVARTNGPSYSISSLVERAMPLAIKEAQTHRSREALETVAKLASLRDNYRPTAATLPLVLLEAVGMVSGRSDATKMASHLLKHGFSNPRPADANMVRPAEAIGGVDGPLLETLARAGLRVDLLHQFAGESRQGDESSGSPVGWARLYLAAGDVPGAIRLLQSMEQELSAPDLEWSPLELEACASIAMMYDEVGERVDAARVAHLAVEQRVASGLWDWGPTCSTAEALAWGGQPEQVLEVLAGSEMLDAFDLYWPGAVSAEASDPEKYFEDVAAAMPQVVTRLLHALVRTGNDRTASDVVNDHLNRVDSFLAQFVWMLNAGMVDGALDLVVGNRLDLEEMLDSQYMVDQYDRHYTEPVFYGAGLYRLVKELDLTYDEPGFYIEDLSAWEIYLCSLIVVKAPDSSVAVKAAQHMLLRVEGSERRSTQWLRWLNRALATLGLDDAFDQRISELQDPGEALAQAVEDAAARGDLHAVLRFANHRAWSSPNARPESRVTALARLAIAQKDAGNEKAAGDALAEALALSATPLVASDRLRQAIVDAAAGRGLRIAPYTNHNEAWHLQGARWLEGIGSAAQALTGAEQHRESLESAHRLLVETWEARTAQEIDDETGRPWIHPLQRWDGWPLVFLDTADSLERADRRDEAKLAAERALRMAAEFRLTGWTIRDQAGRTLANHIQLGKVLGRAARLNVTLFREGTDLSVSTLVRLIHEAAQEFEVGTSKWDDARRAQVRAALDAADSVATAALGLHDEARARANSAAEVLTSFEAHSDASISLREQGLAACVATFAFLGDFEQAILLTGYITDPGDAAAAHSSLAEGYAEAGDFASAIPHASIALERISWSEQAALIRRIDPSLIAAIGKFEDELWKANTAR